MAVTITTLDTRLGALETTMERMSSQPDKLILIITALPYVYEDTFPHPLPVFV